jgi:hypothetical protein
VIHPVANSPLSSRPARTASRRLRSCDRCDPPESSVRESYPRPTAWRRSGSSWTRVSFPGQRNEVVITAEAASARIPGTPEVLAGGFMHAADNTGVDDAGVLLEFEV